MAKRIRRVQTPKEYLAQPAIAAIVAKLRKGATIEQLRGDREPHTVRAILSRLRSVAKLTIRYATLESRPNVRIYKIVSPKKRGGAK